MGCVRIAAGSEGLALAAHFPLRVDAAIPAAPPGTRVEALWEYDVAECFLVGAAGDYLEVELGAGGHFLVLGFDAPRSRVADHEELALRVALRTEGDAFRVSTVLPWAVVPRSLQRINAFAIFGDAHLAWAALPSDRPDFHQPARYPAVTLEGSWPAS